MNPDLNMLPGYPGLKSWPPFAGTQQFNSSTENQKNDMAHTAKPDARFKRFNPKRLPLFMACLLLFALTGMTDVLHAQSGSGSAAAGRQFYVSFLHSKYTTGPDLPSLGLKVAVMRTCRITARNNFTNSYLKDGSGNDWDGLYTVAPGIYTFDLPYNDMVNTASGKTSKTITVSSTEDINVYAINYQNGSTDAATVLPVSVWGTEYYLATGIPYPHSPADYPSACSVTAREDGTQIFLPGTSTPITLNENEVYHYYVSDNLTGKKVTATKPVAVFSGNVVASSAGDAKYGWTGTIGLGGSAEHCYEQLWSTDKWGTDFFVWPVKTTSVAGSDWGGIMCIVAHGNGTKVTVSGGIDGGPHEYNLNDGGMAYVSIRCRG
ncbi:MAG: IgGFc-binding protein [Tannerella sp.]|jgi:hypothetical protein|nr:IgGFc-binding protein [Tannerella sp.]